MNSKPAGWKVRLVCWSQAAAGSLPETSPVTDMKPRLIAGVFLSTLWPGGRPLIADNFRTSLAQ
ncbi:hypothetical protein AGR1C_Lc20166 [Agrobacterium fabacearum TT111]|nr:hypothetical protein AGR1C_Lc20166 [Agrobacterium fabacearum TT111]